MQSKISIFIESVSFGGFLTSSDESVSFGVVWAVLELVALEFELNLFPITTISAQIQQIHINPIDTFVEQYQSRHTYVNL